MSEGGRWLIGREDVRAALAGALDVVGELPAAVAEGGTDRERGGGD